ncbi:DASS family sodium-coupled anion symporter [Actinomyces sp. MRS3W]|uniref:DASS family sodium-coupled anion symporter n=1 Tax=Actinomyces sp. MRS3W TaxID=2800796 RepID=UPI0028FD500C|nr:DASS family sodium-coupled anion symporter [Actinomyces sp. MRS3W]MDU0348865.1 DASS family sodium-coupled anion symporter [Actinomyces sp. MRS3W]
MTTSRLGKLLACVAIGIILWFIPAPGSIDPVAWHVFAIFVPTIVGFMLKPLPTGVLTLIALTVSILTGTLDVKTAMSGYSASVVWLIVAAFLFARAMMVTRLGHRIAYMLIRSFGRTPLRLAYALAISDVIVSPVVPSNTARAGGIFYPIIRSTADVFDSRPGPTSRRLGAFLIQAVFQTDITASALTVTAVAGNALIVSFASEVAGVNLSWGGWLGAALLPAVVSIVATPWLVYRIYPPELTDTTQARALAQRNLDDMGPLTTKEKWLLGIFIFAILGWATAPLTGFNATAIALAALCAMLIVDVMNWKDIIGESAAWDAMLWMGGILSLATALSDLGFFDALSSWAGDALSGIAWPTTLILLCVVYMLTTYGFASGVAHITAMYPVFLAVATAAGAPVMLSVYVLAFVSSLQQGLTHYSSGPAAVFFGGGYVDQRTWWRLGAVMLLIQVVIYAVVGLPYWKVIGLW